MSTPAKAEAPAAAAKPGAKPDAAPAAEGAPAGGGGAKSLLPVIIALVLAPAVTWATVEFVLVPRLQKKLAAAAPHGATAGGDEHSAPAPAPAPAAQGGKEAKGGKDAKGGGPASGYEFTNVVVNLSGTMGTRYLKTSFLITGSDPQLKSTFEGSKPKLTDVTLNVLSSLTLADLEEAGAKNILREKLVNAYNQALGRKIAEQVYFSDFVIQ
ncbi:MAG: flagellar basal body-associated FliL family protein [Opitutaceae bacterium]|nr:flagellar basal body-associated FliL family protein [Opitutaceae bacterium]